MLIDNRLDDTPVAAVMAENRPAVETLTEHPIVVHGRRRIASIAGPPDRPSSAERHAGYATALASHGLPTKVAEQPAVVGFDDNARARLTDPPLTTVRVHAELMGRRGAGLLLEQLESDDAEPPTAERIPAAPRFRGSCGCMPPHSDDL